MSRGFPDNDFLLLQDEPGYRGGEPTDEEDETPAAFRWDIFRSLQHARRGVKNVVSSFVIDTVTGHVTETL